MDNMALTMPKIREGGPVKRSVQIPNIKPKIVEVDIDEDKR
jgi:hypothetical protein